MRPSKVKASFAALFALTALVITANACSTGKTESILPHEVKIEAGDIVLRRGGGITSHVVTWADKKGVYSHIGIAVDSAGVIMICHAVPGEPEHEGDPDRVKLEWPEKFFAPEKTDIGCIMRCDNRAAAVLAAREALKIYAHGALFDHEYNEADTLKFYCCELIEFAYQKAGYPLTGGRRRSISLPGIALENLIFPSDFRDSDRLNVVKEF